MTTKVALCKFALIRTQEAIAGPSQPVQIVQHQNAIDPESIAKKLNEYWMPIWQKDTHDLQFVHDQSGQDASYPWYCPCLATYPNGHARCDTLAICHQQAQDTLSQRLR